ncbi:UNVERIFIED_CONTAM: hypothetical protein FKN15_049216 [Acipenser sinensis]
MELPPNPAEREQQALTLTIKTPNQAFADQTVPGVVLTWTVKELKTHLTRIYPSHPPEKDQRLIYSGKLLPDHLHMKDIFRKSDTQPTLHLVCSFKPPLDLHQPTQAKVTERNPRVDSAPRTPSQAVGAASPPAAGDGLRHRGNLQHGAAAWTHPAMHTGGDPQSHPGFAAYSMYNPQQLLWLQQMYARQYYMHYQAALAAAAASPPALSPQSLPVVPPGAPALADQAPVNQNIAPPAPINPGANQNLRMNAQGGPVMEEEEELNRDWLDWLYTASRFSVFLSILYFYSSAYSMYNPQQLLWLQQMYARQYYMHYQAALAAAAASPPALSPQSLPVVPPGAPALADQAPVNQNIAPPAPINPGANQNLRMNAQGGPVMEEEEELNRDWLDWLYTASRFSVFLSILYFYSSVSRFVMVMSALMVLYLYTAGWFPFRQRPARPVPNNPVPVRAAEDIQNQENHNHPPYPLESLEIHNLSIGKSEVELRENDAIGIEIHNVSATFKGALHYGYESWLPGWMKKLFTDFISFTVKLVIKSQICKEINTVANIMADFIQERAELFLSDGDIGVDISLTTSPSMRASYIESHHKGLVLYRKVPSSFLSESVFSPALLSESRMLYFWISDQVLNPMVKAAHEDGRFIRHIAGDELKELFQVDLSGTMPDILHQIISSENPVAKVWSLAAPELLMVPQGTIVKSAAAVELRINSSNAESPALYIETDICKEGIRLRWDGSDLEPGLTSLMDRNCLSLFEIINPEIITQEVNHARYSDCIIT